MVNFQEKMEDKSFRRVVRSKYALVLLGLFILFFGWNVIKFSGRMEEISRNKKNAEEKIIALQEQKDRLVSDINKLNTDKGVEDSIRDKFGLAKEGEGLVVVVDGVNTSKSTSSEDSGFWSKIKSWFK